MGCFQGIEKLIKDAEIAIARRNSIDDLETQIYTAIGQCDELRHIDPDGLARVIGEYLRKLHGEADPILESLDELMKHDPPMPKTIEWQH